MRWKSLLCGGVLWLLAGPLLAQTVSLPDLPAETEPEPEPSPSATTPSQAPPLVAEGPETGGRWEYELSLSGLWDSNINFRVPGGPDDGTVVPEGSLARTFVGPRSRLRLGADGRWVSYADQTAFNRGYATFDLDSSFDSSPRTHWQARAAYALGHSDSSQPLMEQGVLLPLVKTQTTTGSLGVSHDLGRRTHLELDGRYYRTDFEDAVWIDGQSIRGTATLQNQLGLRNSLAVVYALETVIADQVGNSYLTHFGSLQWTHTFSPRIGVALEGGGSYTPSQGEAALAQQASFFGGISLSRQAKGFSLAAFVRREVTPAFGIGISRLSLRTGLTADIALGRRWDLRLASIQVRPDPTDEPGAYASTVDASVELGRRLGRRFEVSGGGSYRRRGASGALEALEAFQAGLSLTLLGPQRMAR